MYTPAPLDHPNIYIDEGPGRAGRLRVNALALLYSDMRKEDQGCGRPPSQPRRRCPSGCNEPDPPRRGPQPPQIPALRCQVRLTRAPVVAGSVDGPSIRRELERLRAPLERTLSEAVDSEHLTPGGLTVRIGIGPDGAATFARRQGGGLSDAHAEQRLLDALRGLTLKTAPGSPFALSLALGITCDPG